MLIGFLKKGLIAGALYGFLFLMLENFVDWSLGAIVTIRQLLFGTFIYLIPYAVLGLITALVIYVLSGKKMRAERSPVPALLLLMIAVAFLQVGYKPIANRLLFSTIENKVLILMIWVFSVTALYLLTLKLIASSSRGAPAIFNRKGIAVSVSFSIALILYYKLKLNYTAYEVIRNTIPFHWILPVIASIGVYMIISTVLKHRLSGENASRIRFGSILFGVFMIVVFIVGWTIPLNYCHGFDAPVSDYNRSKGDPPNIILLVIDTLRSDHMSLYGYEKDTTPILKERSLKGVVFNNAYAASSWTFPSMVALSTSRYPDMNHIDELIDVCSDSLIMLPEILKQIGYQTSFFTTNPLLSIKQNYAQGIDDWRLIHKRTYKQLLFLSFILSFDSFPLNETAYKYDLFDSEHAYGNARRLNSRVLPWLELNQDKVFFLQLHYMDPHLPYNSPKKEYSEGHFFSSKEFRSLTKTMKSLDTLLVKPETLEKITARYDDEILFFDENLDDFFRKMEELKLWENTLLIITSDHGDEFQEHGLFGHSHSMFNELIHIPLIIFFPEGKFSGKVIDKVVGQIDVLPTILDYLNIEGNYQFEGLSLIDLISGESGQINEFNRFLFGSAVPLGNKWGLERTRAIWNNRYKYVRRYMTGDSGRIYQSLFDMKIDPGEQNNIISSRTWITDEMTDRMDELIAYCDSAAELIIAPQRQELTLEEKENLRAIGYIR